MENISEKLKIIRNIIICDKHIWIDWYTACLDARLQYSFIDVFGMIKNIMNRKNLSANIKDLINHNFLSSFCDTRPRKRIASFIWLQQIWRVCIINLFLFDINPSIVTSTKGESIMQWLLLRYITFYHTSLYPFLYKIGTQCNDCFSKCKRWPIWPVNSFQRLDLD